jgi:hypothetical protein
MQNHQADGKNTGLEKSARQIFYPARPIWMQQAQAAYAHYWARYSSEGITALA